MMDKVKADLREEICVIIRGKIAKAVVVVVATATTVTISKTSVVAIKQISIDFINYKTIFCAKTFFFDR